MIDPSPVAMMGQDLGGDSPPAWLFISELNIPHLRGRQLAHLD